MKTAILYTVCAALNLIAFAVGVSFLPQDVALHFTPALVADRLGSAWELVAMPALSVFLSFGIWSVALLKREKSRTVLLGTVSAVGAVFSVLGWVFFALAAQGLQTGEKAIFPIALTILAPLSLAAAIVGNFLSGKRPHGHREGEKRRRIGEAMLYGGLASAAGAVVFHFVGGWVFSLALFLLAAAISSVCALFPIREEEDGQ